MKYPYILFFLFGLFSCTSNDSSQMSTTSNFDWIVPNVIGNFSPFPLAENPVLFKASDIDFLNDETLVAMISFGGEIRVYPYNFVHTYEAVNDKIGEKYYSITYCPQTNTVIGFNRKFNNNIFTLRASGYLYKENQVLHDASTDTFWSQLELRCIKGQYQTENYSVYNLIETRWKIVKQYFPNAYVFTNNSIGRGNPPIPQNGDPIYGIVDINAVDNRDFDVYAYHYDLFDSTIKIYFQNIKDDNIIIIGSKQFEFITSYINNSNATFYPIQNQYPVIMGDNEGNKWTVFGVATEGPRAGQQLKSPYGFFTDWWAWNDFYQNIDLKE